MNQSESDSRILVIGDPHFKTKYLEEGAQFVHNITKIAEETKPDMIVCLGDILDKHETVDVMAHKLVCQFIDSLSNIAPLFCCIGNHDLINHSQFLTENHIFTPFKKWRDVVIVDEPKIMHHNSHSFIFCPYVAPGRFVEALNTLLKDQISWEFADCIFAHQEFRGCKMGAIISENGDEWEESYPLVISGHIHEEQKVQENILYPGSAIQHSYGESPDKYVWLVTFREGDFNVEKINTRVKGKKTLTRTLEQAKEFDFSLLDKYRIRLNIKTDSHKFQLFKKTKCYASLITKGVKVVFSPITEPPALSDPNNQAFGPELSYEEILCDLVDTKNDPFIKNAFHEILT